MQSNTLDHKIPPSKYLPCQDSYSTLNRRSRFLLAFLDENEERNDDEIICKDVQCLATDTSQLGMTAESLSAVDGVVDDLMSSRLTKEIDDDTFFFPQFSSESDRDNVLPISTLETPSNAYFEVVLNAPNNASVKRSVHNIIA